MERHSAELQTPGDHLLSPPNQNRPLDRVLPAEGSTIMGSIAPRLHHLTLWNRSGGPPPNPVQTV